MKAGWLWRALATALLAAWAAVLLVAAVRLSTWDRELVQTLLQIRADHAFRVRMAERREPIPREWYRSRALALLATGDKLQDDDAWTVFIPGAWRSVDDLRDRLARRIEREFSEIAVDTIRRELDYQASQLTGVPRHPGTGELLPTGSCAGPGLPGSAHPAGAATHEPPELQDLRAHLDAIEQLDEAVRALLALQAGPGPGDAERLRLLVRFTLGAELPGPVSRSIALFRQVLRPADGAQPALRLAPLHQAVRCSVGKRVAALDGRLFERNDLLLAEAALAARTAELNRPAAPNRPLPETLERWREVVSLTSAQERLLAQGGNAWMHAGGQGLGPQHEALFARIGRIGLLGGEAVDQLRGQSGAALQRLRLQLDGSPSRARDTGLVWLADEGRFVLPPQRLVLRDELAALLREPFMAAGADHALPLAAGAIEWDLQRLADALGLRQVRRRFARERLPRFPAGVRVAVARVVDRQLAQHAEDAAAAAIRPVVAGESASFDATAWRGQRQQAARVQALLAELGARAASDRLRLLLAGDLVARLAVPDEALAQSALWSPLLQDFTWWSGEGAPVLGALRAADALTLREVLAQQISRLDAAARQAAPLLEEAGAGAARHPMVLRWQGIVADLERYHRGRRDSSLLALERTLLAIGPELHGGNCAEHLSPVAMPRAMDAFAERHRQLLDALSRRCGELRRGLRAPPPPVPDAVPFG